MIDPAQTHSHGLRTEPIIEGTDYMLGGYSKLKGTVVRPDGQWLEFIPPAEKQFSANIETNNCTAFGTTNAIEILMKAKFGKEINLSDRMVGKGSGTSPVLGNYPKAPADYIRKNWSVFEKEYPFVDDIDEYYKELPRNLVIKATGRGAEYNFGYEYVRTHDSTSLMQALEYSPVCISVALMPGVDNEYYKPDGWRDSHWTTLIGYEYGKYWLVFDSYPSHYPNSTFPPHVKKVRWDTKFETAIRYSLERQIVNETPWRKFLNWINTL